MFLIVNGSPKKSGLCRSVLREVERGAVYGGESVEILTPDKSERCHVCYDGWGTCRTHECQFGADGFNEGQEMLRRADLICFITPVYWGEVSETMKCFLDRFRRCESGNGGIAGKQCLLIASAGGSGNGITSALTQLERFCSHTNAVIFDYISINRWNNDYKRSAAYEAARAMAQGRKNGETVKSDEE
jgi:multimeric flavodoxin WrbA